MNRRGPRLGFLAGLVLAALPSTAFAEEPLLATVGGTPTGRPMNPGFVGVSLEFEALHLYTGRNPNAINPVFVRLVRGLTPGTRPIVRIGGDSSDDTWWPIRGMIPPGGINYSLTQDWLKMARTLAERLDAQLILGVNLAAGRPEIAATEARAFLQGIGRPWIEALEIGNEPDVYNVFPWYRNRLGRIYKARNSHYNFGEFLKEFSQWRAALPSIPIAGPAFAELDWLAGLTRLIAANPDLRVLTIHRYPLHGCPSSPRTYASIDNMLSDDASQGLAAKIAPYVATVHNSGLRFRIDEMNSAATASCLGRPSASDTFASALWAVDTLFNLANVGVDGVNFHSLPRAAYELFTFSTRGGRWQAFVHPDYYGMLLFGRAFPPGARLLPTTVTQGGVVPSSTPVKAWATYGAPGTIRVVLINKDPAASQTVQVKLPRASGSSTLEWMQAPSASATSGVTLGGQTFGARTYTGILPAPPHTQTIIPLLGTYSITLPPASAVLMAQG